MNEFEEMALKVAAASPCEKRKVGAIFTHGNVVLASGYNYNPDETCCELDDGATKDTVVHAEVATLDLIDEKRLVKKDHYILYVTHAPCRNCDNYINVYAKTQGIKISVRIVEKFMKFDAGKPRYDLIPSEWTEGLAEVLTAGAKKYKPNNWRKAEDPMRYYSAAQRHMEAIKKYLEGKPGSSLLDDGEGGIGTHHLKNAMVNIGFLLAFTETEEKAKELRDKLIDN